MINNNWNCLRDEYLAPACSLLSLYEDAAVCETSFPGADIQPGEGIDWGDLE